MITGSISISMHGSDLLRTSEICGFLMKECKPGLGNGEGRSDSWRKDHSAKRKTNSRDHSLDFVWYKKGLERNSRRPSRFLSALWSRPGQEKKKTDSWGSSLLPEGRKTKSSQQLFTVRTDPCFIASHEKAFWSSADFKFCSYSVYVYAKHRVKCPCVTILSSVLWMMVDGSPLQCRIFLCFTPCFLDLIG